MRRLVACERRATVALIASLAEFDARRLYLSAGFSSLFTYCTQHLNLGEGAAYRRIEAARTCRRLPAALGMLAEGAITLTALTILAPCLSEANHVDVLARAMHKSRRKVEIIAAELQPRPDAPGALRRLPQPRARMARQEPVVVSTDGLLAGSPTDTESDAATIACAAAAAARVENASSDEPGSATAPLTLDAPAPRPRRPDVEPLAPERFKLQVTIDRKTHDTLREIQALIRHAVADGDLEEIVARAFQMLRDHLLRQKTGQVQRPRAAGVRAPGPSRYIPAGVRRKVWTRDEARCGFVGPEGRCEERAFLEFHHVRPFAAGGTDDETNIELRCRAHNRHEAALFFGDQHMDDALRLGRAGSG